MPRLDDYISKFIGFPGSDHDDQVDSTTKAVDYFRELDVVA
jgi:phage terminase large subunit-like protein